jgi:hypothetical protein
MSAKGNIGAGFRFANQILRKPLQNLTKALPAPLPRFQPSSLLAVSMEMSFTPFRNRMDAAGAMAPDFRALVGLLAAAQAAQPTGRLATRLALGETRQIAATEALISLFAPGTDSTGRTNSTMGAVLKGCFNPTVPFSSMPVTARKGS